MNVMQGYGGRFSPPCRQLHIATYSMASCVQLQQCLSMVITRPVSWFYVFNGVGTAPTSEALARRSELLPPPCNTGGFENQNKLTKARDLAALRVSLFLLILKVH